jgi:hypothetical protein
MGVVTASADGRFRGSSKPNRRGGDRNQKEHQSSLQSPLSRAAITRGSEWCAFTARLVLPYFFGPRHFFGGHSRYFSLCALGGLVKRFFDFLKVVIDDRFTRYVIYRCRPGGYELPVALKRGRLAALAAMRTLKSNLSNEEKAVGYGYYVSKA